MSLFAVRDWPLKWYFSLNSSAPAILQDHAKAAVRSAKKNTTLAPHLIYDADDDELCAWMRAHGVEVIHARVPWHDRMFAAKERGYAAEKATGTFLRTMIAQIDLSDRVVLATDCDVLFLKDPVYRGAPIRYFAAAPESDIHDYSQAGMNTGAMFMNLALLRKCSRSFGDFIDAYFEVLGARDQAAYRMFFNGLWERLDPAFNWKPYWGVNPEACIVHFHGPKYDEVKRLIAGKRAAWRSEAMFHADEGAYRAYLKLLEEYL